MKYQSFYISSFQIPPPPHPNILTIYFSIFRGSILIIAPLIFNEDFFIFFVNYLAYIVFSDWPMMLTIKHSSMSSKAIFAHGHKTPSIISQCAAVNYSMIVQCKLNLNKNQAYSTYYANMCLRQQHCNVTSSLGELGQFRRI